MKHFKTKPTIICQYLDVHMNIIKSFYEGILIKFCENLIKESEPENTNKRSAPFKALLLLPENLKLCQGKVNVALKLLIFYLIHFSEGKV